MPCWPCICVILSGCSFVFCKFDFHLRVIFHCFPSQQSARLSQKLTRSCIYSCSYGVSIARLCRSSHDINSAQWQRDITLAKAIRSQKCQITMHTLCLCTSPQDETTKTKWSSIHREWFAVRFCNVDVGLYTDT